MSKDWEKKFCSKIKKLKVDLNSYDWEGQHFFEPKKKLNYPALELRAHIQYLTYKRIFCKNFNLCQNGRFEDKPLQNVEMA